MKSIAFLNNRGEAGRSSLVYHLAWMYQDLGLRVLAADLDPQANLAAMFLTEERLEELWPLGEHPETLLGAVLPIMRGLGEVAEPHVEEVETGIGLVVGDLGLATFEDCLASNWSHCLDRDEAAFMVESAFYRVLRHAATRWEADLGLVDVGPNLSAINRAALLAAEYVILPLAPTCSRSTVSATSDRRCGSGGRSGRSAVR